MEYKKNYKYFYANWIFVIVGCVVGGFGLFMTILTELHSNYFIGLLIVGAGIAVFSFAGKLRDSDIDEQVKNVRNKVCDQALKEFGFTERQLKTITSQDFGEFEFPEGETLHVKRGSDGKFRSSVYNAWSVSTGRDDLYFYTHRVSLTEEKESTSKKTISLDNYSGISIGEHAYTHTSGKGNSQTSKTPKTVEVKYFTFDVKTLDGEIYSLPVHPDIIADEFIKKTDHIVDLRRKEKAQG
jgi:hypothetical protein